MTISLPALRRQLASLQRRWRFADWDITLELRSGPMPVTNATADRESSMACCVPDICTKRAIILLPDVVVPRVSHERLLAHEFAHVVLAELYSYFLDVTQSLGAAESTVHERRWVVAQEWVCNAFAEAVTKEVS